MDQGLALVLVAAITATSAVATAYIAASTTRRTTREEAHVTQEKVDVVTEKVEAVHQEVKTMNGTDIGELAADDETRRIEAVPFAERTRKEQRHLDEADPPGPPQGPPR